MEDKYAVAVGWLKKRWWIVALMLVIAAIWIVGDTIDAVDSIAKLLSSSRQQATVTVTRQRETMEPHTGLVTTELISISGPKEYFESSSLESVFVLQFSPDQDTMSYECEAEMRTSAIRLTEQFEFDSAAVLWSQIEEICKDAESCFYAGTAFLAKGEVQKGALYLEHAIELDSTVTAAWLNLSVAIMSLGYLDSALILASTAVRLQQDEVTLTNRAIIHVMLGNLVPALEDGQSALKLNSSDLAALAVSGLVAAQLDSIVLAQRYLDAAADLDPTDIEVLNNLGMVENEMGNKDRALELFLKSIALDSSACLPRLNAGRILFSLRQWHRAATQFAVLNSDCYSEVDLERYVKSLLFSHKPTKAKEVLGDFEDHLDSSLTWAVLWARIHMDEKQYDSVVSLLANRQEELPREARNLLRAAQSYVLPKDSLINLLKYELYSYPEEPWWAQRIYSVYGELAYSGVAEVPSDSMAKYLEYFVRYADTSVIRAHEPRNADEFIRWKRGMDDKTWIIKLQVVE